MTDEFKWTDKLVKEWGSWIRGQESGFNISTKLEEFKKLKEQYKKSDFKVTINGVSVPFGINGNIITIK